MIAVFWKELADHFNSKRFIILLALVYLAGVSAVWTAAQGIRGAVTETTPFIFLKLFIVSGGTLPPFITFLTFLIPIVGIILGFDAVNSERASGTLSKILSQPVFRDAVINGKFLAGLTTIAIMLASMILIASGMGLRMLGIPPSGEEVLRLVVFLLLSVVYGAFWLGLAILFSTFFRRVATSLLASIGIWLFFAFFMFMIASAVANMMVPIDQNTPKEIKWQHEQVAVMTMRASPTTLFGESVTGLLAPEIKSLGPVLVEHEKYMLRGSTLSFGQSLLMVWPHLVSIIALTLICFAISYVKFLREEIRST